MRPAQLPILRSLGTVCRSERIGGGCISEAWQVELDDGRSIFVKYHANVPADFFAAEAAGLQALHDSNTIAVPSVLAVDQQSIAMTFHQPAPRAADASEILGTQLAALHACTSKQFGFSQTSYCGATAQDNSFEDDGYRFYAERRLQPLAAACPQLTSHDRRQLDHICESLPQLIPDQEPALIHGDLWGGNAIIGEHGQAMLVDPAVSYCWPEAELAMTTLFGGFDQAFYSAYEAHSGIAADWRDRCDLYNLYHLLNHLLLFGSSYLGQVRSVLQRYGA